MKNKLEKLMSIGMIVLSILIASLSQTNAAVDVSKGIKQATNEVMSQFKGVLPTIFTVITLVCLGFTVFKIVKAFMTYHQQEKIQSMPIVLGIIGTIISSLASAWSFFSAFGV